MNKIISFSEHPIRQSLYSFTENALGLLKKTAIVHDKTAGKYSSTLFYELSETVQEQILTYLGFHSYDELVQAICSGKLSKNQDSINTYITSKLMGRKQSGTI